MRKAVVAVASVLVGASVHAQQNSTTNCYAVGNTVQCNTQTQPDYAAQSQQMWQQYYQNQQQQQQQFQQNMQNLGAAMAVAAERRRERKAAEQEQAHQQAVLAAANAAMAADTATAQPRPPDETPVLLSCTMNGKFAGTMALYEKHSRVDVTTDKGVTKTRSAVFTQTAVTWKGPLWDSRLSRLDGSLVGYGNIPELQGISVTGNCSVATERKF